MRLSVLSVLFLLGFADKGETSINPNMTEATINGMTSTTANVYFNVTSGSHKNTGVTASPPSSTEITTASGPTATTANVTITTTIKPTTIDVGTAVSQLTTGTPEAVNSTNSPTDLPSTPTRIPFITSPETSKPRTPPTGSTTTSSTITTTSTNTISTGIPTTMTSLQPDITTTNFTTTTPIIPVIECPSVPCPPESVCLNGTCQCLSGSFLLNGHCESAIVFPGQLHIPSLEFQVEMRNRASAVFQTTAALISAALKEILQNQPGYINSDVVKLAPGSVQATINNIFQNTDVTQGSVERIIKDALENSSGVFDNSTFTSKHLCEQEPLPCDSYTTTCTSTSGRALCSCKPGYISIVYSNSSCRACPSGEKAVGNQCKPCDFGYSGFNCNDSALLAVVVVSCLLGGILLLICLGVLIFVCCKGCSKSELDYDSSPYASGGTTQAWPTGITSIPRANTNWDNSAPIEMAEGRSPSALVDKSHQTNGSSGSYDFQPEAMKTFTGKNPSRYSYLVQGHENPYFLPEDEGKN